MVTEDMIVDVKQSNLLARLHCLRAHAWALRYEIGLEFTRNSAAEWRERSWQGLATACWALSQDVQEIPGTWDIYQSARDLAIECATQGEG